jgi:type IV pilus assembly protein PilN
MIGINLLPYREERRQLRRTRFYVYSGIAAIVGVFCVFIIGGYIDLEVSSQESRNRVLTEENQKLDGQIKEIAGLRQEIEALKARHKSVQDLQGDRNMAVFLLDDLIKFVPEGAYIKSLKQDAMKITVVGVANSNERVSELMRNIQTANFVNMPELIEIKAVLANPNAKDKDITNAPKFYEFILAFHLKKAADVASVVAQLTQNTSSTSAVADGQLLGVAKSNSAIVPMNLPQASLNTVQKP